MSKTRIVQCFALCIWSIPAMAQYMWQEGNDSEKTDLGKHCTILVLLIIKLIL